MAVRNVFMRNFPVISVKLAEGALTRSDIIGPNGGKIEGVVSRASPLVKGDLVKIAVDATKKPAADDGIIMVEKQAAGAAALAEGILVSEPSGVDSITVSTNVPEVAQARVADVAFFGLGIIEIPAAGATVAAGSSLAMSASVQGAVITKNAPASGTSGADNGGMLALTGATVGKKVAVLIGATVA